MLNLTGGKLIQLNPERPDFSTRAAGPFLNLWLPGSLWASSGACTLIERGARQEKQGPRPPYGEVFVRLTDEGARYICVSPKVLKPERQVDFRWATDKNSLDIRHLEQVFADARLEMAKGVVYRINCQEATDSEYGNCIAALWAEATARPRFPGHRSTTPQPPITGQAP